jgi:voltage-gated potassium channel
MTKDDSLRIALPSDDVSPGRRIARRLGVALGLVVLIAMVTYIGRDGYYDPEGDGTVSLLDSFYYSTVTITTTGYGDVRPVSDEARLVTTLVVTPARVLFLILLVGTTLEILAERSRHAFRVSRWRKNLHEHTIVCGYGTKGRAAVHTLLGKGVDAKQIVVIDGNSSARMRATADGIAAVGGDASTREALEEAGVADAASVLVCVDRDDTAILVTLTVRELNPNAKLVASVREEENVHLLLQGGADGVITSSAATGRLLGLSSQTPQVSEILEDILTVGKGLDVVEQEITAAQAGPRKPPEAGLMFLGLVRGNELIRFDDPRSNELQAGDRLIELCARRKKAPASA